MNRLTLPIVVEIDTMNLLKYAATDEYGAGCRAFTMLGALKGLASAQGRVLDKTRAADLVASRQKGPASRVRVLGDVAARLSALCGAA